MERSKAPSINPWPMLYSQPKNKHQACRHLSSAIQLMIMSFCKLMAFIAMTIAACSSSLISALDCGKGISYSITVSQTGKGKFSSIQAAIDSIPENNNRWVQIYIQPGTYKEQVRIEEEKPCIFLEGASSRSTIIEYDAHDTTLSSATFTLLAENFVAKRIQFKNSYNLGPPSSRPKRVPAVAALIQADKASFRECGFTSLQDTLWDEQGRHYFYKCYIEGAVDFIFGGGQSIYEDCALNVTSPGENSGGFITAQRRNSSDHPGGFVFKGGAVVGYGPTYLGRAYGPYSRVIFSQTVLTRLVNPLGWDAWNYVGKEGNLMYVENHCTGEGSDTSKRVKWQKWLNAVQIRYFTDITFIDKEGWLKKQPSI